MDDSQHQRRRSVPYFCGGKLIMIRNEWFDDGVCICADIYDLDARWYQREEAGVIVSDRAMTDEEIRQYVPQPLDATVALATLLATLEIVPVQDAANAVGLTPEALEAEAQAWWVAANNE